MSFLSKTKSRSPRERIRAFVLETFLFTDDPDALKDDESFLEKGIIDSTGALELILFLEEEFSIQGLDEELVPENLDSVQSVDAFLQRKLQAA